MLTRLPTMKQLLLLGTAFVCLHGLSIWLFPANQMAASYPFLILAPVLALAVCCWSARKSSAGMRRSWIAMSVGLLIWTIGTLISAWEDVFHHASASTAIFSDFVYFLYGAPVLLAISSSVEDQGVRLFFWLDGLQVAITVYLIYIKIFSVAPFTGEPVQPISGLLLTLTYNVENLVLAVCATLRLVASPRGGERSRFYQILSSFLWIYAGDILLYNHLIDVTQNQPGLYDLIVDLPILFFIVASIVIPRRFGEPLQNRRSSPLALFIDNVSPLFFTLAMLALGFTVMREHYEIGTATIIAATAVYGLRAALIQSRYMQSRQELQEARDRLEEMSLKDSLTGVANRRSFDQTLESEWHRAMRLQHPLSLLMVDVDHFKNLNDTYGHRVGDDCLTRIATALGSALSRSGDLLARYGGEEFAVILPATNRVGAEAVAFRMQEAIRSLNIRNVTSIGEFTTVSVGVAVHEPEQDGDPETLVEASDRALYRAKQNGRDRVEYASVQAVFDTPFRD